MTSPNLSQILKGPSLVQSSLLLGCFVLMFFLSRQTIPPFLRSSPLDLFLLVYLAILFNMNSNSYYISLYNSFILSIDILAFLVISFSPFDSLIMFRYLPKFTQNSEILVTNILLLNINCAIGSSFTQLSYSQLR